jgi:hypothetical protein
MALPRRKNRYAKTNQITQLAGLVNDIGGRLGNLAAGLVVIEAILEDAGILTPERSARIKPLVRKKLGIPEPTPPAEKDEEPTECCERDNKEPLCGHMTPVPQSECKE